MLLWFKQEFNHYFSSVNMFYFYECFGNILLINFIAWFMMLNMPYSSFNHWLITGLWSWDTCFLAYNYVTWKPLQNPPFGSVSTEIDQWFSACFILAQNKYGFSCFRTKLHKFDKNPELFQSSEVLFRSDWKAVNMILEDHEVSGS